MLDLLWLVLPSIAVATAVLLVYARVGTLRVERPIHQVLTPPRRAALPPVFRARGARPAPESTELFASDSLTTLRFARPSV
jgi:hypothetical protein